MSALRLTLLSAALLIVMSATLSAPPSAVGAGSPEPGRLPAAQDLAALAEQARARDLPILLMFARHGCPYCTLVEGDFLEPMQRSGNYHDKIIMRRVMVDSRAAHVDFDGSRITAAALAQRYGASLTPTVVFVDADGREIAPRLVGITTPDFYGGELDDAIDSSLDRLHGRAQRSSARADLQD